jgi:hypothetical protein
MPDTPSARAHRGRGLTTAGLIAVTAATLLMMAWAIFPTTAFATHVPPVQVDGNPTCGELSDGEVELKVEPVADGTFTDGTLTVTIDVRETADGPVFDWTSNIGVDAVFAKGGPTGNLYLYDPPTEATSDTGLHAPVNASGKFAGLSHISFCYDKDVITTTSPTTTTTTTTSPTTTTTTSPTTTTTTTGTTTTTVPGGGGGGPTTTVPVTTTVPPSIAPTTVTPSTTTRSPSVAPTTVQPNGTAFTGPENVVPIGAIALMLLTSGSGLLWAGSRRKRDQDQE